VATEKNISSRIINKHDIETNWNKATNFIPKAGEIIVYDKDETYDYERFKIGDGETAVADLSFGSVQPDWNENDETTAGYVKNRTHWIESSIFVPEQNISNAEFLVDITANGVLEAGRSYSVTVDGASYILDTILLPDGDFSGNIVLGNPYVISHDYSSLDNGFTFGIIY
jgi:hypothetical protein